MVLPPVPMFSLRSCLSVIFLFCSHARSGAGLFSKRRGKDLGDRDSTGWRVLWWVGAQPAQPVGCLECPRVCWWQSTRLTGECISAAVIESRTSYTTLMLRWSDASFCVFSARWRESPLMTRIVSLG